MATQFPKNATPLNLQFAKLATQQVATQPAAEDETSESSTDTQATEADSSTATSDADNADSAPAGDVDDVAEAPAAADEARIPKARLDQEIHKRKTAESSAAQMRTELDELHKKYEGLTHARLLADAAQLSDEEAELPEAERTALIADRVAEAKTKGLGIDPEVARDLVLLKATDVILDTDETLTRKQAKSAAKVLVDFGSKMSPAEAIAMAKVRDPRIFIVEAKDEGTGQTTQGGPKPQNVTTRPRSSEGRFAATPEGQRKTRMEAIAAEIQSNKSLGFMDKARKMAEYETLRKQN